MDSFQDFDNVKLEKANAIARYRRFKNITKLLQVIEVFVVLTLVSWSWTRLPATFKITREVLIKLFIYFLNPHVVFLIGNVIVLALFFLSRHYEVENYSDRYTDYVPQAEEFVSTSNVESELLLEKKFEQEKQIVSENLVKNTQCEQEKQIVCGENLSKMQCEAADTAILKAKKQIRKFQRTQSENLRSEIRAKPRPELRRSVTERRQIVVKADEVESLSNEEFRLTIEAFIAKQQRFLYAQKMADYNNY